jgi:small redox-active disulfide protein 2
MKKIQILGTGCAKCKRLTENTEEAVSALGGDYEVEKVTAIEDIMMFGIMMTPALAVDGEVRMVGKVLSVEEIKKLIQERPAVGGSLKGADHE